MDKDLLKMILDKAANLEEALNFIKALGYEQRDSAPPSAAAPMLETRVVDAEYTAAPVRKAPPGPFVPQTNTRWDKHAVARLARLMVEHNTHGHFASAEIARMIGRTEGAVIAQGLIIYHVAHNTGEMKVTDKMLGIMADAMAMSEWPHDPIPDHRSRLRRK